MDKLIIGCEDTKLPTEKTNCLVQLCKEYLIPFELVNIPQLGLNALQDGKIDVFASNLSEFPLDYDTSFVIGGLSKRKDIRACVRPTNDSSNYSTWYIPDDMKISISNDKGLLLRKQILSSLSQVTISDKNNTTTNISWQEYSENDGSIKYIDPRDIIPPTGSGVYCFVCLRSNINARRKLQELHESSTAYCTNVERTFVKECHKTEADTITAHCVKDKMGNYHLHAYIKRGENPSLKIKHSQSTFINLAENAIKKL